jgi:hypothetical protein
MRTLRRLVASLAAAVALGLVTTGATLAADPTEVDLAAIFDGDGQAGAEPAMADDGADADARANAAATFDAEAAIDPENAALDSDAAVDPDADAAADTDGSIGADEGNSPAEGAGDACLRLAISGDAGACGADSAPGSASGADDNAVETQARLAKAADAGTGDEGTAATTALGACTSVAVFDDASSCETAGAPPDGDRAPGAITALDSAAGDGPGGGSLPDTASNLFSDPLAPLTVFLALVAGSALLRRLRRAMG